MDIKTIFKNIILNPLLVFSKIKMVIKSFFLTRKIDIGNGKIILKSDLQ